MRQTYGWALATSLACALTMACGGSDGANDDRRAQQPQSTAPEKQAEPTLELSGCVETGPGTNQYMLRNVRLPSAAPQSARIIEGSLVRLASADRDLGSYAGQRVSVTGVMTDSGRNTIGTAGTSGVETPSGDRSQAASSDHHSEKVKKEAGRIARESMANATTAEIQVRAIESTGERCQTQQERTRTR